MVRLELGPRPRNSTLTRSSTPLFPFVKKVSEQSTQRHLAASVITLEANYGLLNASFIVLCSSKIKRFREEEMKYEALLSRLSLPSAMTLRFDPDKVYIMAGGLGGLGLEISNFLVERGATKLALVSRGGISTGYQNFRVQKWQSLGITARVIRASGAKEEGAREIITEAMKLGPIGGIFNFAGAIQDAQFYDQTEESFVEVLEPKLHQVLHLDRVSRELCGDTVDWFVAISSLTAGRGNAGQTNYGFANSAMERAVIRRRDEGYRGCMSIEYGGIGDTGILLRNTEDNDMVIDNSRLQRIVSIKEAFEFILLKNKAVMSSVVRAETVEADAKELNKLAAAIFKIFTLKDVSEIDPNTTLAQLGMDSIQSVQIKHMLDRVKNLKINTNDIGSVTVGEIKELDVA